MSLVSPAAGLGLISMGLPCASSSWETPAYMRQGSISAMSWMPIVNSAVGPGAMSMAASSSLRPAFIHKAGVSPCNELHAIGGCCSESVANEQGGADCMDSLRPAYMRQEVSARGLGAMSMGTIATAASFGAPASGLHRDLCA